MKYKHEKMKQIGVILEEVKKRPFDNNRNVDLLLDALSLCLDVIEEYQASQPTLPASPPTTPSDAS